MKTRRAVVIVLAGGSGRRFSDRGPKHLFFLRGKPVLFHSLKPFIEMPKSVVEGIIITAAPNHIEQTRSVIQRYFGKDDRVIVIEGGKYRIHSYLKAIAEIKRKYNDVADIIAHDAVRPLITKQDVTRLYKKFVDSKADSLVVSRPIPESLYIRRGNTIVCLPRKQYLLGQSPNFFKSDVLKDLHEKGKRQAYRDGQDILELLSKKSDLRIIDQDISHPNIKITYPDDMEIAAALFKRNHSE